MVRCPEGQPHNLVPAIKERVNAHVRTTGAKQGLQTLRLRISCFY